MMEWLIFSVVALVAIFIALERRSAIKEANRKYELWRAKHWCPTHDEMWWLFETSVKYCAHYPAWPYPETPEEVDCPQN